MAVLLFFSIISGGAVIFYATIIYAVVFFARLFTRKIPLDAKDFIGPYTYTFKIIKKDNLKLDIYYPKHKKQKHPVVFFSHGGGWISGFRNQPNNVSWCRYLASKGFATVSIDYRYGIKNEMKDILNDYSDALKYIKKHALELRLDKNNIILMGLSAGGHLALLYSSYNTFIKDKDKMKGIKGVVSYYTPSDLNDIFTDEDSKSSFAKFAVKTTLKGNPDEIFGQYNYYSPYFWISERMIPTLLVHGKNDDIVPFNSSVKLIKKLKESKIESDFFVHNTGGHTFEFYMNDIQTIKIIDKTRRFIKGLIKYEN